MENPSTRAQQFQSEPEHQITINLCPSGLNLGLGPLLTLSLLLPLRSELAPDYLFTFLSTQASINAYITNVPLIGHLTQVSLLTNYSIISLLWHEN